MLTDPTTSSHPGDRTKSDAGGRPAEQGYGNVSARPAQASFDYTLIPADIAKTAREAAVEIKRRLQRASVDIIEAGAALLKVKAALPHGMFLLWLHAEFGWTPRTARSWMKVAERLAGKTEMISALPPTALQLLATAPESATQEIDDRVREGARPTVQEVKRTIKNARERDGATMADPSGGSASHQGRKLVGELTEVVRRHAEADATVLIDRLRSLLEPLDAVRGKLAAGKPVKSSLATCGKQAEDLLDELYRLTGAGPGSAPARERCLRGDLREVESVLRRIVNHAQASRETRHVPPETDFESACAKINGLLAN
jgi:hypothetical protein